MPIGGEAFELFYDVLNGMVNEKSMTDRVGHF
jgi:hypothetical protein